MVSVTGGDPVRVSETAWDIAASVPDPELPMVTLADLGILRNVVVDGDRVSVTITPTYAGCPAMREISHDLQHRLQQAGYADVAVRTSLAPPWSSDWITCEGRAKLAAAGIAPPNPAVHRLSGPIPLNLAARPRTVACRAAGRSTPGRRRPSAPRPAKRSTGARRVPNPSST